MIHENPKTTGGSSCSLREAEANLSPLKNSRGEARANCCNIRGANSCSASPVKNSRNVREAARGCKFSMIETADILANRFGLKRDEIDDFAYSSHERAFNSIKNGLFRNEILPLNGVSEDDCVRNPDRAKMSTLKPVLETGSTTAANASQLSDGCSLAFLMKRRTAERLNLEIQGVFVDYAVVGVDPSVMGVGPAFAIPKLLEKNNLTVEDISVFEINEAFGSQALYCQKLLGIPREKLNRKGGSIALGHPLGCTGARLVSTLLNGLHSGLGVVSLCAGTGHGVAALIKKE